MISAALNTPGFALGVADQVGSALWREIVGASVTQPQFLALSELHHSRGISHYELAERVGIDKVTIGPIVKRLGDLEWIERRKDEQDGRRSVLTIGPSGDDLLRRLAPSVSRMTDAFMSPLTATEQAVVVQSWATIARIASEVEARQSVPATVSDVPFPAHYPWFFLRIARRSYRKIWRDLADEDISPSQFSLMSIVASSPGIDIRTAAELSSVEETTAVRIIMRSIRLRLMRDMQDPQDARRSLLRLTQAGTGEVERIALLLPRVQAALCHGVPTRALGEFHRLTRTIARLPDL
jgi:DNA-binding MarR family transcriptional regulator